MPDFGRWFDGPWYLSRNPDVARAGLDPLAHYERYGEGEGRFPSAWFDPAWYRASYGLSLGRSPLAHFLERRASGRFLPCAALYMVPLVSPWREAVAEGADPFDRYLKYTITPERELLPELASLRASGLIEPSYHAINQSDRYTAELDPVLHYVRFGWALGWRPGTAFDPAWYAMTNPDAARPRINPLMHYLLEGEAANRRPVPWFDPAWYRETHAVPADANALVHYLAHRGDGRVSPNPLFDAAWYVARHGHAIPAGVDPFSHYLVQGAVEDIDPSPRFDARLWRHGRMAPLGAEYAHRLPVAERNPLVHCLRTAYEDATTGRRADAPGATTGP